MCVYQHETVNHWEKFIEATVGCHTQLIQSFSSKRTALLSWDLPQFSCPSVDKQMFAGLLHYIEVDGEKKKKNAFLNKCKFVMWTWLELFIRLSMGKQPGEKWHFSMVSDNIFLKVQQLLKKYRRFSALVLICMEQDERNMCKCSRW